MQNFIVLGIIPGTNIQLDFQDLMLISISLIVVYGLVSFVVRHAHKIVPAITNSNSALIGPINIEEVTI